MVEDHKYWDFQPPNVVALAANRELVPFAELDPDPDGLVPISDPMLVTQFNHTSCPNLREIIFITDIVFQQKKPELFCQLLYPIVPEAQPPAI